MQINRRLSSARAFLGWGALIAVAALCAPDAVAYSTGIFGRSGEASLDCKSCHGNNAPSPTIQVEGLDVGGLEDGGEVLFTLRVTPSDLNGTADCPNRCVGFSASTDSAGIFEVVDDSLTKVSGGGLDNEVAHLFKKQVTVGLNAAEFQIRLTDLRRGDHTFFVAVNDVNGDNSNGGADRVQLAEVTFTVGENPLLFARLGGDDGLAALVDDVVGRLISDSRINGYFTNNDLDPGALRLCFIRQLNAATGGGETYPGNDGACLDMEETHSGLGISTADFDDFIEIFSDALTAFDVSPADTSTIVGVLNGTRPDIIEDANNDDTIYQRIGRGGAVSTVVGDAVGRILADSKINGYFFNGDLDASRLVTCLERQICEATGGPCIYDFASVFEPSLIRAGTVVQCRDMVDTHVGRRISQQDQDDLIQHFFDALTAAGAPGTDIGAIIGVLNSLTPDIVEDLDNDQIIYQRVGRKPGIQTLVENAVGTILIDPSINGFFLNEDLDAARLTTCLVRQFCEAANGPCQYANANAFEEALVQPTGVVRNCADMLSVHLDMGVSQQDFDDLLGHFGTQMQLLGVSTDDQLALVEALLPLAPAIIEDTNNDASIYQRIGRKLGIELSVDVALNDILGDPRINGYFLNEGLDTARLSTCLSRQLCEATGGPCFYASANAFEGALVNADGDVDQCLPMLATHAGMGVSSNDFTDLADHFATAILGQGASQQDVDAIIGVLGTLQGDIVEDVDNDDTPYQRIGRKGAIETVISDTVDRIAGDVAINGFFLPIDADGRARLETCFVRQVCEATAGPCDYDAANAFEDNLTDANSNVQNCLSMLVVHSGMTNDGVDDDVDGPGITGDDFAAVAGHASDALAAVGLPTSNADHQAILSALAGTCEDIVDLDTNPYDCVDAPPPSPEAGPEPGPEPSVQPEPEPAPTPTPTPAPSANPEPGEPDAPPGGCGCSAQQDNPSSALLWSLAGLMLWTLPRRRRRR